MPVGQFVSFSVCVDNLLLPEYTISHKNYTEISLKGPSSYIIEEDDQKYPVVPFSLHIKRHCKEVVWIKVYLDGQVVRNKPLRTNKFELSGVKVGSEIRELLFSLPKIKEDQETMNPLGELASTIKLEVFHVNYVGQKKAPVFKTVAAASGSISQDRKLQHLTKRDIASGRRDQFGTIVSREGRSTLNLTPTGHFRIMNRYVPRPDAVEELLLYYRPHIPSYTPITAIKQEDGEMKDTSLQPRAPLGDVGNMVAQQRPAESVGSPMKVVESVAEPREVCSEMTHDLYNMDIQCGRELTDQSAGGQSTAPEIPPQKVKSRPSCDSAMLPPQVEIKTSETDEKHGEESSSLETNAPKKWKTRPSCDWAMVPPQQLMSSNSATVENRWTSEDHKLEPIPLQKMKSRPSCASAMTPPQEQVKTCETDQKLGESSVLEMNSSKKLKTCPSYSSALSPQPQEQSNTCDTDEKPGGESSLLEMMVPKKMKSRPSCAWAMVPQSQETLQQLQAVSAPKVEQVDAQWQTEATTLSDESDGEMDESVMYMGREEAEGESLIYMGDDDCCVLDVSNHVSIVEIDDDTIMGSPSHSSDTNMVSVLGQD
ncbi:uncharacterized protein LOC143300667 [Babylonia areolata]|uniref:uncharacterized protein LOC143300667 n=1 Tax=Babylonia areolata TaxID=304850 RepID=UPI003FD3CB59